MKFAWSREEEKLIPCKIVHHGAVRELLLHHLSDADTDEADRRYPAARPPQLTSEDGKPLRDAEGRPALDVHDQAYASAAIERATMRTAFLAVLALGPEAFEAREIDAQIAELRRSGDGFTWASIRTVAAAATKDAALTPEMLEAAKEALVPFGSPSVVAEKSE